MKYCLLVGWALVALISPAGAVTCQEAYQYSQTHTKREQWQEYRKLSPADQAVIRECIREAKQRARTKN